MTEGVPARDGSNDDSGLMNLLLPNRPDARMRPAGEFSSWGDGYTHTRIGVAMLPAWSTETVAFGILLHDIRQAAMPRRDRRQSERRQGYFLWAYRAGA